MLKLDAAGWQNGFYFWYIFLLAGIYLILPFINLLCDEKNKKIRRYIVVLTIVKNAVLPFFTKIAPLEPGLGFFTWPFDMGIGFVLLGYELKMIVPRIKNWQLLSVGIIMYLVSTLLMYGFTMNFDVAQGEFSALFFTWSDLFPLLQGIGIFISIMSLKNLKPYSLILYLGKISYNIYLIHYPVSIWMESRGIAYRMYNYFPLGWYLIIYAGINFIADIMVGSVIELLKKMVTDKNITYF